MFNVHGAAIQDAHVAGFGFAVRELGDATLPVGLTLVHIL